MEQIRTECVIKCQGEKTTAVTESLWAWLHVGLLRELVLS